MMEIFAAVLRTLALVAMAVINAALAIEGFRNDSNAWIISFNLVAAVLALGLIFRVGDSR